MKNIAATAVFALMAGLVFPAYATTDAVLNVNGSTQVNTRVGELEIEMEDGVEIEIEEEDGVLQVKTEGNATSSARSGGNRSATSSDNDGSDDSIGSTIRVDARTVRGWDADEKQAFMLTLKTALQVQTNQELEHFAQGVLLTHDNVSEVEIDDSEVKIKSHRPARLFGLVGSSLAMTVSASEDAQVKVKFPWYRFLFNVEGKGAAEIEQSLDARMSAFARSENQIRNRAYLLELLSAAVEEEINATAAAEL